VPTAALAAAIDVESASLLKATKYQATVNFPTDEALPRRAVRCLPPPAAT
jgi:hypothetical protein